MGLTFDLDMLSSGFVPDMPQLPQHAENAETYSLSRNAQFPTATDKESSHTGGQSCTVLPIPTSNSKSSSLLP